METGKGKKDGAGRAAGGGKDKPAPINKLRRIARHFNLPFGGIGRSLRH